MKPKRARITVATTIEEELRYRDIPVDLTDFLYVNGLYAALIAIHPSMREIHGSLYWSGSTRILALDMACVERMLNEFPKGFTSLSGDELRRLSTLASYCRDMSEKYGIELVIERRQEEVEGKTEKDFSQAQLLSQKVEAEEITFND